jgi:hypothetical protein
MISVSEDFLVVSEYLLPNKMCTYIYGGLSLYERQFD